MFKASTYINTSCTLNVLLSHQLKDFAGRTLKLCFNLLKSYNVFNPIEPDVFFFFFVEEI